MSSLIDYRKKLDKHRYGNYVYTLCKEYIVTLKRLPWASTNEESSGWMGKHLDNAIFRGNEFLVIKIDHIKTIAPSLFLDNEDPISVNEIGYKNTSEFGFYHPPRHYKIKSIVKGGSIFPMADYAFCIDGIHGLGNLIPFCLNKINLLSWLPTEIYENAKYSGIIKRYYQNGSIQLVISMENGKLHGDRLEYNDKNELTKCMHYRYGKLDGKYFKKPYVCTPGFIGGYKEGKLHGLCYYIDKNGEWVNEKGNYVNGRKNGKFLFRDEHGYVTAKQFEDNNITGEYIGKRLYPISRLERIEETQDDTIEFSSDDSPLYKPDHTQKEFNKQKKSRERFISF
jgi:hypothetical protein